MRGKSPPARVAWIETFGVAVHIDSREVATREGGVDRNDMLPGQSLDNILVATREGGVDRNTVTASSITVKITSPPARVAWIETSSTLQQKWRKRSPPARVAWIETFYSKLVHQFSGSRHPRGWRG